MCTPSRSLGTRSARHTRRARQRTRFAALLTALGAAAVVAGCETTAPRSTRPHNPDARWDYPDRARPQAPVESRAENPTSGAWPLDMWLVEFANRNGVDLRYRDQDVVNRTVISPGPGPFDSEEQAIGWLRQVARANGLGVTQEKPHVYSVKHTVAVR